MRRGTPVLGHEQTKDCIEMMACVSIVAYINIYWRLMNLLRALVN